ncbi:MAG: hypothetical protein HY693_03530 [Deltaproteobacteria bacterium]|nr:hypothetical protein [Deltaproteobacteria bacterium]
MIKLFLINVIIISGFYLSLSEFAFSQSTGNPPDASSPEGQSPTSGSQQPTIIQGESDVPWYYYWPDENLDPFGMSTLGNEGGSTFGKSRERPSNLQVNPPIQEQRQDEVNVDDLTSNIPVEDTLSSQESISIIRPSTSAKKGPIYKWVDDNGVIQVTNNLGSVPPKYLDKITIDEEHEGIE